MFIKKQDSETEHHQHISGFISAEGEIISGEGIESVAVVGIGRYQINFETPFAEQPAVVATLYNDKMDLSVHAVITYEIAQNHVKILTGNADGHSDALPAGAPQNSAFCFIAFGDAESHDHP